MYIFVSISLSLSFSGHYRAMRFFDWKIAVADIPKKLWLFNLAADAVEAHNIGEDIDLDVLVVWTRQGCFEASRAQTLNMTDDGDGWIDAVHRRLQALGDVNQDSHIMTRMQFACSLLRGLQHVDSRQAESLWPSVSETVLRVDQPSFLEGTSDGWNARRGDEFVYWPN